MKVQLDEKHLLPETTKKGYDGYIKINGYILVKKPNHPFCRSNGYVPLHRLIMEVKIGRFLDSNEDVHHINGIKDDNSLKNLLLLSRSEHMILHKKGKEIGTDIDLRKLKELYKKGYSTRKVAEFLGCGKSSVAYYVKKLGISRTQQSERGKDGKFIKREVKGK